VQNRWKHANANFANKHVHKTNSLAIKLPKWRNCPCLGRWHTSWKFSELTQKLKNRGQLSQYSDWAKNWTRRDSNPGKGNKFIPFSKTPRPVQGTTQPSNQRVHEFFPPWVQLYGSVGKISFVKTAWLGLIFEWFYHLLWLYCAHPNLHSCNFNTARKYRWARGGAVGSGNAIQHERSWVRFPMASLEFFIGLILVFALWPWSRLSL